MSQERCECVSSDSVCRFYRFRIENFCVFQILIAQTRHVFLALLLKHFDTNVTQTHAKDVYQLLEFKRDISIYMFY
jgi:hypothetical protein